MLHVFLDDCGNLVRKERMTCHQVDNFDGAWFEGIGREVGLLILMVESWVRLICRGVREAPLIVCSEFCLSYHAILYYQTFPIRSSGIR